MQRRNFIQRLGLAIAGLFGVKRAVADVQSLTKSTELVVFCNNKIYSRLRIRSPLDVANLHVDRISELSDQEREAGRAQDFHDSATKARWEAMAKARFKARVVKSTPLPLP